MLKSMERSISSWFHGTVSLISGNRWANRHQGYLAGKCSGCGFEALSIAKGGKDFPYFAREDCIWHESGGCCRLQRWLRSVLAYLVFLVPPQADSHLHNMYTEALPFTLAQSPSSGAKSKQGKPPTP
jgi:hypothetical protein